MSTAFSINEADFVMIGYSMVYTVVAMLHKHTPITYKIWFCRKLNFFPVLAAALCWKKNSLDILHNVRVDTTIHYLYQKSVSESINRSCSLECIHSTMYQDYSMYYYWVALLNPYMLHGMSRMEDWNFMFNLPTGNTSSIQIEMNCLTDNMLFLIYIEEFSALDQGIGVLLPEVPMTFMYSCSEIPQAFTWENFYNVHAQIMILLLMSFTRQTVQVWH